MKVQFFRAADKSRRFNKGQNVWIKSNHPNHLSIFYKWRAKGRYVTGYIDKFSPLVGEIKTIEVADNFAKRIIK